MLPVLLPALLPVLLLLEKIGECHHFAGSPDTEIKLMQYLVLGFVSRCGGGGPAVRRSGGWSQLRSAMA